MLTPPAQSPATLHAGVMSGTSMDAIDAIVATVSPSGRLQVIDGAEVELPTRLKAELYALNTPGSNELDRSARAANELAGLYAQAIEHALQRAKLSSEQITSVGVHGQTVRHRPDLGYTVQLNAPGRVAELTGIDTVADFRTRDIAGGGQGAPLVPAFHASQFGHLSPRVVLNMGGIANVTLLGPDGSIRGFDTGPANMLMDGWTQRHLGAAYDADGTWARSGDCIPELLARLLQHSWFSLPPPKSTGRDDFHLAWLDDQLARHQAAGHPRPDPADVQATLLRLSAESIVTAIRHHAGEAIDVLACGGGTRNRALMETLQRMLPCPLRMTDEEGLPAQWVEAAAFAWLAWCYDRRRPAGLPGVTGARHPTVLGCKYMA